MVKIYFMVDLFRFLYYNLSINNLGDRVMKKITERQRKFLMLRSKKENRMLHKRKKHKKKLVVYIGKKELKKFKVPNDFSILDNSDETLLFFERIIKYRNSNRYKKITIHLNFESVEKIGVEALMYLIAVMNDSSKYMDVMFKGSFPKDKNAYNVLLSSGFTDYVNVNARKDIRPKDNKIRILKGKLVNPQIASEICTFVQKNFELEENETSVVYKTLVELMENTRHHAYDESCGFLPKEWYIFAECIDEKIVVTFLDTGLGIPATVRKSIRDFLPFNGDDAKLMQSTLNGDWRTETEDRNRGKGLPKIAQNCCSSGLMKNMYIYSGKGVCMIDNTIRKKRNNNKVYGTLFNMVLINERR